MTTDSSALDALERWLEEEQQHFVAQRELADSSAVHMEFHGRVLAYGEAIAKVCDLREQHREKPHQHVWEPDAREPGLQYCPWCDAERVDPPR